MKPPRLTVAILTAIESALLALESGIEGEGDWTPGLPRQDVEDALDWVAAQIRSRGHRPRG
jgi:hypothetical protein